MYYSPNGARAFVYVGGGDCINWELVRSVVFVNPIIPSTLRLPNRNALTQLLSLERNNLRFVNQYHLKTYEILAFEEKADKIQVLSSVSMFLPTNFFGPMRNSKNKKCLC